MGENAPARAANLATADTICRNWREACDRVVETDALGSPAMTIGQVAREFGLTFRALRFYEAKHLLSPRRHGAKRLYRRSDRERLALILTGRRLGFTLAEISELVGRPDGNSLHLSREKCIEQIALLERQKRGIEIAIAELRQIYTSFYKTLLEAPEPREH
jgi:DNA-binding transcriptional MerR regulator